MRRVPHFHASMHADGKYDGTDRTPFIFVGNNPYETTGLDIGERRRLDTGKLWVCRAPGADRAALIKMAMRALFGRTTPGELKILEAEELWVQTRARPAHQGRQRRRGVHDAVAAALPHPAAGAARHRAGGDE